MMRHKRILALLLCVGIALALLVSSGYEVHEAHHDCVGDGCAVCALMAAVGQVWKMLGVVLSAALLLAALRLSAADHLSFKEGFLSVYSTLVHLKIRLND